MAIGSSFKQKCPSCEAMVAIKDPSLVGKKVECSKCKYRFVVENPIEKDKAAVKGAKPSRDEDGDAGTGNGAKNGNGTKNGNAAKAKAKDEEAAAKGATKKRFSEDDLEDKGGKSKAKTASAKKVRDEEAEAPRKDKGKKKPKGDEDDDEAPSGSGAPLKLLLGLGLALVGVVVLAVAAWLILSGGGRGTAKPAPMAGGAMPPGVTEPDKKDDKGAKKDEKPDEKAAPVVAAGLNPELTNLFPGDTEHVFHVFMKDAFEPGSGLRDAVFQAAGSLGSVNFKKRLGFDLTDVADIIRAEKYTPSAWSMSVLFFAEPVDEKAVIAALGLRKEKNDAVKLHTYYKATKPNPTFDYLARFSFGVPQKLRLIAAKARGPLYVRFHNPQTVLVADEEPLVALLRANSHFPELTPRPVPPAPPPDQPAPGTTPGSMGMPPPGTTPMPMGMPPGMTPMPMGMPPPGTTPTPMPMPMGSPPPGQPKSMPPVSPVPGVILPGGTSAPVADPSAAGLKLPANAEPVSLITGPAGAVAPATLGQMPPGKMPPGTTPPGTATPPGTTTPPGMMPPGSTLPPGTMPPGTTTPPGMMPPGTTPGNPPPAVVPGTPPAPPLNPRDEMYLTIKPRLKQMLDHMEALPGESKDKVLFSSATDLEAARIGTDAPEFKNQVVRIPRELWDVTYLLEERRPGLKLMGTALVRKDTRTFQLRNELECNRESDAKDFYHQLMDKGAPQLVRFFDKLLDHKIELPKEEQPAPDPKSQPGTFPPGYGPGTSPMTTPPMPQQYPPGYGPMGMKQPGTTPPVAKKPRKEAEASQITLTQSDQKIEFTLDLVLDQAAFGKVLSIATLTAGTLHVALDRAMFQLRHELARAGKIAAEKGLTEKGVEPGRFPPGAFAPEEASSRKAHEPKNRISWMAGLLPYMGQDGLYARISFKHTWRDPNNWIAAKAVIPEFLDPSYPEASRQVLVGGIPLDFGATHFVGVAGVGLDAASYPRDDPAYIAKRGIFGYDKSASVKEVADGRGLSNTIMMLQVPHDGPGGVNPWIAGGGATVRGVPDDKNPIAPFLLTIDRGKNPITYKGKRGTYALMADGTVRFIDQNVSPEVFKAMCTIGGPAPEDFNLTTNPHTPLVPAPKKEAVQIDEPAVVRPPVKKEPLPSDPGKPAEKAPPGWVTFTSPDGYSVAMPHQPQVLKQPTPVGDMNLNMALLPGKKLVFVASSLALPANELAKAAANPDELFRGIAVDVAASGGKILKESPVTLGKYKGREYLMNVPVPPQAGGGTMTGYLRLYLAGNRIVFVMVSNGGGALPPEGTTFFNSLKIGN